MIEDKLSRYGNWCMRQRDGGLGWPNESTLYKIMKFCLHANGVKTNSMKVPTEKRHHRETEPNIPLEFEVLEAGIASLLPAQKDIINAKYLQPGRDKKHISRLGITKDTFYYHLNTAHKHLFEFYQDLEECDYILRSE